MTEARPYDPALRVLHWYGAMGVDAAVDTDAIDWFARGAARPGADFVMPEQVADAPPLQATTAAPARRPPPAAPTEPQPTRKPPPPAAPTRPQMVATTPDAAVIAARQQASAAKDIAALGTLLEAFDGCALKATAKSLCFYRGAVEAKLMVIGEAPGREEDLAGKPFVGPAGQLLDKMLAAIGIDDTTAHITNVVYWRPPGNRTPTPQETEVCRPFLERQVALVKPEIVFLLGGAAAKLVLGVDDGIMRLRGKWRDVTLGGHAVRVMPSLHPAYLLRTPAAKQQAWRDLLSVKAALAQ